MFRPAISRRATMPRASFDYEISEDRIIQITDLDTGTSVTNDIEAVLVDIARAEGLASLQGHRIIYRDTLKRWDGIQLNEAGRFDSFYSLGQSNQDAGIQEIALARVRERKQVQVG